MFSACPGARAELKLLLVQSGLPACPPAWQCQCVVLQAKSVWQLKVYAEPAVVVAVSLLKQTRVGIKWQLEAEIPCKSQLTMRQLAASSCCFLGLCVYPTLAVLYGG